MRTIEVPVSSPGTMREYKYWKPHRLAEAVFSSLLAALGIYGSLIASSRVEWIIVASFVVIGLGLSIFYFFSGGRSRLLVGDQYLEVIEYRRRRIYYSDIQRVTIFHNCAVVRSSAGNAYIAGTPGEYGEILRWILEKTKDRPGLEFYGDPFAASFYLDRYKHRSDDMPSYRRARAWSWGNGVIRSELGDKGWMYRQIKVMVDENVYLVEYYGRGMNYECVLVQGEVIALETNNFWLVPEFRFKIGEMNSKIRVRMWPWFTLRSLTLEIEGVTVYSE